MERLRSLGQDEGRPFLVTMIEVFLQEATGHLRALRAAVAAHDAQSLWRAAHALRGACGNVGAARLAAISGELELEGRSGSLARAGQLTARAESEFVHLTAVLEREKGMRGE